MHDYFLIPDKIICICYITSNCFRVSIIITTPLSNYKSRSCTLNMNMHASYYNTCSYVAIIHGYYPAGHNAAQLKEQ